MEPTLLLDAEIGVDDDAYIDRQPRRGEIVVYAFGPTTQVNRVVALEGEQVEAVAGKVLVGGVPLDESYLPDGLVTGDFNAVDVPSGMVFTMGDNRGDSRDSRFYGPIEITSVEGRVVIDG